MLSADHLKRSQKRLSNALQELKGHQKWRSKNDDGCGTDTLHPSLTALVIMERKAVLYAELAHCCALYDRLKSLQLAAARAYYTMQDIYVKHLCKVGFDAVCLESYRVAGIRYHNRIEKLSQLYVGIEAWKKQIRECLEEMTFE
ncbi:hypothetical protein [Larkinella arboricola]